MSGPLGGLCSADLTKVCGLRVVGGPGRTISGTGLRCSTGVMAGLAVTTALAEDCLGTAQFN